MAKLTQILPPSGTHASRPDPDDPILGDRPGGLALFSCEDDGIIEQFDGSTWGPWYGPPAPWALIPQYGAAGGANTTIGASNRTIYAPAYLAGAATITGIRLFISNAGSSSPTICVALYDEAGTRLATSGAVAVPGTNTRTIDFTSPYAAMPGRYWLAVGHNNDTINVQYAITTTTVGNHITQTYSETAYPCPATMGTLTAQPRPVIMIGMISGGQPA